MYDVLLVTSSVKLQLHFLFSEIVFTSFLILVLIVLAFTLFLNFIYIINFILAAISQDNFRFECKIPKIYRKHEKNL